MSTHRKVHVNPLSCYQWIAAERLSLQILPIHIHPGDLTVFIGGVIVNATVRIAAGGVDGDLILSLTHMHAAPLLCHGAKNVEKLADAFGL